ncbi:monocarboxylate transporter 6-like isoform X3 [Oncorhynchus keta]|uniref:monocarboxylate transporter 6-like isoform X3 n=1 Tax=Oncorhynchus keta TaxID=8018 RepID=UPI00227B9644|nr:monocarboxylate transporter 6-like isoform X3 [Oncorhynchus keta]
MEADLAEGPVHSQLGRMTEGVELEARQNQSHRTQRTRQNQTQGDTVLLRRGSGGEGPQGPKGPEVRAERSRGSEVRAEGSRGSKVGAEGSSGSEDVVETRTSQDWTGVNHSTVRRSTDSDSEEQEENEEEEEEEGSLQHHHLHGLPPHNGPTGEPGAGLSRNGYAQQVAPDGGWGWVVLVATILVLALTLAFPSCIGIFYTELQAEFSSSNTETSWVPAIMTAVLHAGGEDASVNVHSGPLCSVLVERFGCRVTVMVGGVLSGLGMVVSALARTITELYITSIIAGLGFCLSFQPSVTMMGHYFLRRRAFANALSSTGTALGLSTLPLLANFLLGQFGWRGSFLVLGGLLLNCCVCGAVMRPLGAKHSGAQRTLTNKAAQGLSKQPIKGPLQQEKEGIKTRLRTVFSDLVVFLRRHMAFDLLVSNPRYRAYALGVTWMMLGFVVPLVYLVPYATANGMEQDRAALLMAVLGLVNIAVRPVAAVFFGLPRFRGSGCFVYVFAVALLVNGLSNSICGAAATFPVLLIYVVIFGLSMSVIGSLLFTVLMETVEMSRFPSALGLISMLESGTLLIGPPLAGMLVDSTGHYSYVFYACSVTVTSSGLFLIAAFYYLDRQKKREEKKRAGPPAAAYQQKPAISLVPDCQYNHVPSTQGGRSADTVCVTNV